MFQAPSVSPVDLAAAAAIPWRHRGQLYLTVVVKGTFAIVPGASMTPVPSDAIARDAVDATADDVPYRARVDVWLIGRPTAPVVRLGVFRDRTPVLDKQVAAATVGELGPVSKAWRHAHAGAEAIDRTRPVLELPDAVDWSTFQLAPPDQRLEGLRGDEWIAFAGVQPHPGAWSTRLPGAVAVARSRYGAHDAWHAVALTADGVALDLERQRCSITWRGRVPLMSLDVLAALQIQAGIEIGDQRIQWPEPMAQVTAPAAAPAGDWYNATTAPDFELMARAAVPFAPSAMPAPAASAGDGGDWYNATRVADVVEVAGTVVPFKPAALPFAPAPPARAATLAPQVAVAPPAAKDDGAWYGATTAADPISLGGALPFGAAQVVLAAPAAPVPAPPVVAPAIVPQAPVYVPAPIAPSAAPQVAEPAPPEVAPASAPSDLAGDFLAAVANVPDGAENTAKLSKARTLRMRRKQS
jgi:hypothetical protein